MKLSTKLGLAVVASALWLQNATAQKKDAAAPAIAFPKAPAAVTIDGDLAEWKDTSFVFNKESKLKYIISSDGENIYVTANLDQKAIRQKVLGAGITISINTEGKKKKTYSITYPAPVDDNLSYVEKQHARQTKAKTDGFKGVSDDITLPEEHGIKGAFAFKAEGGMGYEVAIPIKLLNIKPGSPGLNINVSVNALEKPTGGGDGASINPVGGGGGGARGGTGGGRGSSRVVTAAELNNSVKNSASADKDETPADMYSTNDFWLSYTLPVK